MTELDPVAAAHSIARSGPLPDAIQGQDRGFFEGRGEEGAGRMGFVVLGIDNAPGIAIVEVAANQPGEMKLLPEPERHRHIERSETGGCEGEIGLQEPLELEQRFIIESHIVKICGRNSALLQAVINRKHISLRFMSLFSFFELVLLYFVLMF